MAASRHGTDGRQRNPFVTLCSWLVFLAVVIVILAYASAFMWGKVQGVEWSPDRFAHRSFRYWEVPYLEIQVTPKQTYEHHTPLEEYLLAKSYVHESQEGRPRWRLIKGFRTGSRGWSGSAKSLELAMN